MFQFKNGQYEWNGKSYGNFREALKAMGTDVCENNASVKFGDVSGVQLSGKALCQFLLMYAVTDLDILALIQSVNGDQYRKWTKSQAPSWIRKHNPLFARGYAIPMNYTSNRSMQCAIWPALAGAYNRDTGFILTRKGKFRYEIVLSYICDVILFSGSDSPFKEALDVFTALGRDERTSDLEKHATHEDYPKLKILAAQVVGGDITVPEDAFISIGDVRASRYSCRAKDEIYGSNQYVSDMLALPPAMQGGEFYTWLSAAADATGKEIEIPGDAPKKRVRGTGLQKPQPIDTDGIILEVMGKDESPSRGSLADELGRIRADKVVDDEEEEVSSTSEESYVPGKTQYDKFANTLEQIRKEQEFNPICEDYCKSSGTTLEEVRKALAEKGVTAEEDIHRAVPVYLRREGYKLNVKKLCEYCSGLNKCYGDCTLNLDA